MTSQSHPDDATDSLSEMPPSAKLVVKTLEHEGELTQPQLAEQTLLAGRTVRSALSTLEDADLVTSRGSVVDARKTLYSLTGED
ncbi:winged helix-turn-helix transcriptional regulator [Halovenus sp. WSH3]|uniref:Winged helix-turn-helix transcriptional regulator n=1 Tax=Halovenus carboxidivorans TaxID=2692199 RepID=A0A6B0T6E9_9EURY|nr:helix-turn-helix domain-containing protein [Halovenus carboxidivorans]MXR51766.1 winged helix-turn-helix transcriptional regulator [Halovenus carboxidivorans]